MALATSGERARIFGRISSCRDPQYKPIAQVIDSSLPGRSIQLAGGRNQK